MFFNIIYSVVVSIIIIFVIHNIFEYFKSTLTTPKIKDLINKPKSEYERINRIINSSQNGSSTSINDLPNISDFISDGQNTTNTTNTNTTNTTNTNNTNTNINGNNFDPDNIKSELKDFFKQLTSEKIDNLDIFTGIDKRDFDAPQITPAFSGFQ